MKSAGNRVVLVNLALFDKLRIFNFFDPTSSKVLNCNNHCLTIILFLIATQSIMIYCGYVYIMNTVFENGSNAMDSLQLAIANFYYFRGAITVLASAFNYQKLRDLFFTRVNFSSTTKYSEHEGLMYDYREKSVFVTNLFAKGFGIVLLLWISFPLIVNAFMIQSDSITDHRYENVLNIPFGVSISKYNRFFFVFFVLEVVILLFVAYIITIFSVIVITLSYDFVAQYDVCFRAFQNIGYEPKFSNGKYCFRTNNFT